MEVGRLIDISPREVWPNEARNFTPWLAENLDRLADAIGVRKLELEGTEVAVENYSADILAMNPADGSRVLIENQLEQTDHSHLGQILTYLAGLNASIVIWVAREFRSEHLSAIRWLNQHTVDPFAFFAVRLRLVRIGDSVPAAIFEVLERPNEWDRRLQSAAQEKTSEISQFRKDYWEAYRARYPEDIAWNVPRVGSNWWWELTDLQLVLSIYVSVDGVGLFVRGPLDVPPEETHQRLEPHREALENRLGLPMGYPSKPHLFSAFRKTDMRERSNWTEATAWMHEKAHFYANTLRSICVMENEPV